MRSLDRYIFREIAIPFLVGMGLFFVVVAFAQLLKISDAVTGLGITGGDVFQALLYSFPPLMGLLIPVSLLFATLLGVGRLASDREIVAMSSVGVGPLRLLRVPALMGLVLAVVSGFALVVGEPWGIRGLRDLMSESAQRALAGGVRAGEFTEWVPGVTFMASDRKGDDLIDVVFADRRDPERPLVISARHGKVVAGERTRDIVFDLKDGAVVLHGSSDADVVRVLRFQKSRYRVDVQRLVKNKARTMSSVQEKSLRELWVESRDPTRSTNSRGLRIVTLHRKLALPLATLIFALLAVPLAARATGGARARGFLFSTGIVGAYYYLGRALELAGRHGSFNPALAAWIPNLLGLAALIVLLVRLKRRGA